MYISLYIVLGQGTELRLHFQSQKSPTRPDTSKYSVVEFLTRHVSPPLPLVLVDDSNMVTMSPTLLELDCAKSWSVWQHSCLLLVKMGTHSPPPLS
mmetsp:Transcript_62294/g.151826  ORF Transcript_62294/g.151826 Transcript_62294/m.151826 type:complete len:96 (-) Transcript_62294:72-359(-)